MRELLGGSPALRESRVSGPTREAEPTPRHAPVRVRRASWRLASDVLLLLLAGTIETLLAPAAGLDRELGWGITFGLLVVVLLALRGAYRGTTSEHFLDDARGIVSATALAAVMITFFRVAFTDASAAAEEAIRSWLFASGYLIAGRGVLMIVLERLYRLQGAGAPTLILGAGRVGHLIARRLAAHPELGLRPVGFLDPDPLDVEHPSDLPVLGSEDQLERVVHDYGIEHVIISFSTAPYAVQLELLRALQRMKVSIAIVPRLFEAVPDRTDLERVGGLPLLMLPPSKSRDWRISVKYALDRVVALLAIPFLSPLLMLAAVGTALTLGSPIIFRQRRVGLDDREFDMLKFRTMTGRAEEHGQANAEWAAKVVGDDPFVERRQRGVSSERRTPRFGAFLRRTNLDELPQLFNVLKGEMSMIGPRPEQASYVALFKDRVIRYADRHQVKAGITGWAQVHGLRGNTSLDDRIEWDNYYIENWSPWLEVKILLLTMLTLIRARSG